MTTPTPVSIAAQKVLEAANGVSSWGRDDVLNDAPQVAAATTRALADALLPRPATGDRSPRADSERLLILQFLTLANELAGNPPPAASREALAEAREESQSAAWQGVEPEQVLPAFEKLAQFVATDIPPGPYSEHDLRQRWSAQNADNWDDMELYEQLAFAQVQAIEADRGRADPTTSAPALPPALVLDGGDGVRIEATNHKRTSWAIRDGLRCLNSSGEWEPEPHPSSRFADFLGHTRWPSAKAAWAALLEYRAAEGVQS